MCVQLRWTPRSGHRTLDGFVAQHRQSASGFSVVSLCNDGADVHEPLVIEFDCLSFLVLLGPVHRITANQLTSELILWPT